MYGLVCASAEHVTLLVKVSYSSSVVFFLRKKFLLAYMLLSDASFGCSESQSAHAIALAKIQRTLGRSAAILFL
ncbi:hypothetical protein BRADI_1g60972v3 [Brachypodium distachyon]|uniref:Uncharacterized protein n=1 Tax=Brachypodium distachyon TaxID=15368 RepID=A0A0Q3HFH7_BRADI|nr:hypothetical protein BRADI_1g60972v3 [Brachypodium distachyon]